MRLMQGQVAHTTLKDQIRALQMFSEHVGAETVLQRITPRNAESFVASRLGSGLSVGSVNKDIRTLRGVFNRAIEPRHYLAEGTNPFASLRERRMTCDPPKYVSAQDFQKILTVCKSAWWRTFLTLAYTCGGRRDELLNLTWTDVDFEEQTVGFLPKRAATAIRTSS
jgi:integrase